jgi:hypothetical protein
MAANKLVKPISVFIRDQHMDNRNRINKVESQIQLSRQAVQYCEAAFILGHHLFAVPNGLPRDIGRQQRVSAFQYGSGIPAFSAPDLQEPLAGFDLIPPDHIHDNGRADIAGPADAVGVGGLVPLIIRGIILSVIHTILPAGSQLREYFLKNDWFQDLQFLFIAVK